MGTLVGISGSLRAESWNTKLVREAARIYNADSFELADLNFPLYNEDISIPEEVMTLAHAIQGAEAVIIASPEYNKALTGVLKNALDWLSVTKVSPWRDKPVAIMSASPGREGGARAQFSLRLCMNPFQPKLLPGPEVLVAHAPDQFLDDRLITSSYLQALETLMGRLKALT